MKWVDSAANAADRFQQRQSWLAFPIAVFKKFGDDRAGNLAALIAYYGFLAFFPLLLLFVTVLDMTLRGNQALQQTLLNSALSQYPVVGPMIVGQIQKDSLPSTGVPLAFAIVFLLLGSKGVAGAMRNALCEVWAVPKDRRPSFPMSWLNDIALVLVVGIGLVATTTLSTLAGGAGHILTGVGATAAAVAVSLVLNVGVFWLAFWLAAARRVRWHDLRIGAAISAVVWQVLQVAGGLVVTHQLHHANNLYGTFGVVLGLLAWLYLQAEVTLYAAEIDAVLVNRLWPRSLTSESEQREDPDKQDTEGPGKPDTAEGERHGRRAA
jgi:YihY family inner membrane protein